MKLLRGVLLLLTLMISVRNLCAIPAYPYPIEVTQPDGSKLTVRLHGDEFFRWMTTEDGYYLTRGKERFYYYATPNFVGDMISTGIVARNPAQRTPQERNALTPQSRASLGGVVSMMAELNRKKYGIPLDTAKIRNNLNPNSSGTRSAIPPVKVLVILVEFTDLSFTVSSPYDSFDRLLNQNGYSDYGARGSAKDYFHDNTQGLLNMQFDVVGSVRLSKPMVYYGENESGTDSPRVKEMALEACLLAKSHFGINFAQYANENNEVENIFIYFAGTNEAETGNADEIWPHAWGFPYGSEIDGVKLSTYACTSELTRRRDTTGYVDTFGMASIGTFCHELGHILGLPDFYDTDYESNGYSIGLDVLSLMARGNYNHDGTAPPCLTSLEQELLGIEATQQLQVGRRTTISPVINGRSYIHVTENEHEYFYFENRNRSVKWDAYIGGDGLFIYHVDMSDRIVASGYRAIDLWRINMVNAYAAHECAGLVSPRPMEKAKYTSPRDKVDPSILFYPYMNVNTFNRSTIPAFRSWDGIDQGLMISNIAVSGENVVMDVEVLGFTASSIPVPNVLTESNSTIHLRVDTLNTPSDLQWYIDDSLYTLPSVTLSNGEHKLKAVFTNDNGEQEVLIKYIRVI